MNRYWDLEPQQRAALTHDQVEAFLTVELMEKGVVNVEAPTLEEVPIVELERTGFYEVQYAGDYSPSSSGFVFKTSEQAQQFIGSQPIEKATKYEWDFRHYAKPCREMTVGYVELPTEHAALAVAASLGEVKATKERNTKLNNEYATARKAITEATGGVWDDWTEQRERGEKAAKVQSTREEYIAMCGGDETVAEGFLAKVFDDEQLAEAAEWSQDDVPV